MKKKRKSEMDDELRPKYDLHELLKGGVRGKYTERYRAGTNLVLLAPDVAKAFANDAEAVNEAATVFGDSLGTTVPDPDHSLAEDRYITVGMSSRGRLVMVAHTERGERLRIISARELTRAERKAYEEETKK